MSITLVEHLSSQLEQLRSDGLFKTERIITTPQAGNIGLCDGRQVINLCANNYLGLSDNCDLIAAGKEAL